MDEQLDFIVQAIQPANNASGEQNKTTAMKTITVDYYRNYAAIQPLIGAESNQFCSILRLTECNWSKLLGCWLKHLDLCAPPHNQLVTVWALPGETHSFECTGSERNIVCRYYEFETKQRQPNSPAVDALNMHSMKVQFSTDQRETQSNLFVCSTWERRYCGPQLSTGRQLNASGGIGAFMDKQ